MHNVFEGSEKKLEITFKKGVNPLLITEQSVKELVRSAGAEILSQISNEKMKAYLLSESSLFLWEDRLTMITCGTTTLADAARMSVEIFGSDNIQAFIYQRKNEYFPERQKSTFLSDINELNKFIPQGQALRLGPADEHHLYLYHSECGHNPNYNDTTLEILMYDLKGKAQEIFNTPGLTADTIRQETNVHKILPGFQVDDFVFNPVGYSINGIKSRSYFTVHVTPQEVSPYVSFETNLTSPHDIQKTLTSVLEVFRPRSFDLVYFDTQKETIALEVPGYDRRSKVRAEMCARYNVHFGHFSEPWHNEIAPFVIKPHE